MRHMMIECPHFNDEREFLRTKFKVPPTFWASQPRCTLKTGWITYNADPLYKRRVELQILVCSLAIVVLRELSTTDTTQPLTAADVLGL